MQRFTKLPRMSAPDLDDGQVPVQLPELSDGAFVLVQRGLWPCLGFLPAVERRIAAGDYKASRLLTDEKLRVDWIDDADRQALRNVNSPEDLRR